MRGRKPKEPDLRVNRVPPVHEFIEVENVPYEGARPKIGRVPAATKRWWEALSTMPHCVLWMASDWAFAVDTARLHAAFSRGDLPRAAELRIREAVMGTTSAARRDLRIRYVEPEDEPEAPMTEEDEERWRKLIDDDA